MTARDYLKVVISCALFIMGTVAWQLYSGQTSVARTFRMSLRIVDRIIIVHALAAGILCYALECPVNYLAIPLALFVILIPVAKVNSGIDANVDPFVAIIALVLIVPVYFIKQFVLGFPDRFEFILRPPSGDRMRVIATTEPAIEAVEGMAGIVVSPLRPTGKIDVAA